MREELGVAGVSVHALLVLIRGKVFALEGLLSEGDALPWNLPSVAQSSRVAPARSMQPINLLPRSLGSFWIRR